MRLKAAFMLTLLSLPAMAGAAGENADTPDAHSFIQGMTVSCHGSGQIWGTDAMIECMAELKGMGVNWIAIHPYGSIRGDGPSGIADPRRNRMYEDPAWLTRPIAEAHKLGLKIMIKPHILPATSSKPTPSIDNIRTASASIVNGMKEAIACIPPGIRSTGTNNPLNINNINIKNGTN